MKKPKPVRLRLSRAYGSRLQLSSSAINGLPAVNVARPSRWGNPYVVGESTQGAGKARPFDIAWARSTIAQCKAAGVPVFMKQIGSRTLNWCLGNRPEGPETIIADCQSWEAGEGGACPEGFCACRVSRAGSDPAEWPMDLRVREFPA